MLLSVTLFLLCALAIYFSCEYFVNGVEWVGRHFNLGATTTGTVLASFGTGLPESAITFVAVVFGHNDAAKGIGVGVAVGGPLVLATISYAVVGLALRLSRRRLSRDNVFLQVDGRRLSRDQTWFLLIFALSLTLGLVAFPLKRWLGVALFGAYGLYVLREMSRDQLQDGDQKDLDRLKLRPRDPSPSLYWAALQTIVALVVIAAASRIFLSQLEVIATHLGVSAQFVALFLSPVATELPETLNAVIWVRQGRERLALANISGAMMLQATVPAGLGVLFTPWRFDRPLIAAVITTACAVLGLRALFRRSHVRDASLIPVGLLYALFAVVIVSMGLYHP